MRFRKKPVVIEAIRWDGNQVDGPNPQWLTDAVRMNGTPDNTPGSAMRIGSDIHIGTLEGVVRASPGDWIIRGVKGEIYPCKPDIFEMTYEPEEAKAAA